MCVCASGRVCVPACACSVCRRAWFCYRGFERVRHLDSVLEGLRRGICSALMCTCVSWHLSGLLFRALFLTIHVPGSVGSSLRSLEDCLHQSLLHRFDTSLSTMLMFLFSHHILESSNAVLLLQEWRLQWGNAGPEGRNVSLSSGSAKLVGLLWYSVILVQR